MEVTRIVTLELTKVYKGEKHEVATEEDARNFSKAIKDFFDVDHVGVTKVQDFIMEEK